jgi:hypothetical protein
MLVLFCTTVQRSIRQTRIKTQNMIVLTVEFTRIPLFPAGEKPLEEPQTPPTSPLDAAHSSEVTEYAMRLGGRHTSSAARVSSISDCTPIPPILAANR